MRRMRMHWRQEVLNHFQHHLSRQQEGGGWGLFSESPAILLPIKWYNPFNVVHGHSLTSPQNTPHSLISITQAQLLIEHFSLAKGPPQSPRKIPGPLLLDCTASNRSKVKVLQKWWDSWLVVTPSDCLCSTHHHYYPNVVKFVQLKYFHQFNNMKRKHTKIKEPIKHL